MIVDLKRLAIVSGRCGIVIVWHYGIGGRMQRGVVGVEVSVQRPGNSTLLRKAWSELVVGWKEEDYSKR